METLEEVHGAANAEARAVRTSITCYQDTGVRYGLMRSSKCYGFVAFISSPFHSTKSCLYVYFQPSPIAQAIGSAYVGLARQPSPVRKESQYQLTSRVLILVATPTNRPEEEGERHDRHGWSTPFPSLFV